MTTPVLDIIILTTWTHCHDCGLDLDRGDEAAIYDRQVICLDCRTARLNEGDI